MQPQIKSTTLNTSAHTHTVMHTQPACMHCALKKQQQKNTPQQLQFTKCSHHAVIGVVLWFYILFMIFTFQFYSYVCFCVLRGNYNTNQQITVTKSLNVYLIFITIYERFC